MGQIALAEGSSISTLDSLDELRAVIGTPAGNVIRKDIGRIDSNFAQFIALSPFALLATSSAAGTCDVSPRGDRPGFAKVLDEQHIALPERPGNKRLDSLQNIMETGRAGLLFLIPGMEETVRVNGRAAISRDAELLESMAVDGKPAVLAVVFTVEEAYLHCAKAFRRSRLWETASWLDSTELPSAACMFREQLSLEAVSVEAIAANLEDGYRKTLW